jgi:hypothetical protein
VLLWLKFKPCNDDQMVMLPISLENQLVPGSLEQTINELVEKHPADGTGLLRKHHLHGPGLRVHSGSQYDRSVHPFDAR